MVVATKPDLSVIGSPGIVQYGGIIYGEWNRDLQGANWMKIIRQMVDGDPIIGGIHHAITMLIRQLTIEIAPFKEGDNQSEAAAKLVREALDDMEVPFEESIGDMLYFLPYGWHLSEQLYKLRQGENRDRKRTSMFNDGLIGWRRFAVRPQDTLSHWQFDEDGYVTAMYQLVQGESRERRIPIEKSIHVHTTTNRDSPEGKSILRNCHRPWYFKRNIENIEAIGIERDLAGLPVMGVPPEWLSPNASVAERMMLDQAKQIVTSIKRDEQEGVIIPLHYDENGKKAVELNLLSSGGQRQFNTGEVVERYDRSMAMSVLADFMMLGHKNVGSFALSSDKTNMFTVAIEAWVDVLLNAIWKQAVIPLCVYNGFPSAVAPRFKRDEIAKRSLTEIGDYIGKITAAGAALFPNPKLENHLLKEANLPMMDDVDVEIQARMAEMQGQIKMLTAQLQKATAQNAVKSPQKSPEDKVQ